MLALTESMPTRYCERLQPIIISDDINILPLIEVLSSNVAVMKTSASSYVSCIFEILWMDTFIFSARRSCDQDFMDDPVSCLYVPGILG